MTQTVVRSTRGSSFGNRIVNFAALVNPNLEIRRALLRGEYKQNWKPIKDKEKTKRRKEKKTLESKLERYMDARSASY